MVKILDRIILLLLIAAVVAQAAVFFSPTYPDSLVWLPSASLLVLFLYFLARSGGWLGAPSRTIQWERAVSDEEVFRHLSRRYGMSYDQLEIECIIANDGSAILRRIYSVEAYGDLEQLDSFLLVKEEAPGEPRTIVGLDMMSLSEGRTVSIDNMKEEGQRLSVAIRITPPLRRGESLKFQLREQLPEGLFAIGLTEEELAARANLWDYVNWLILRPTRKLKLTVSFPESKYPKVYDSDVRYASPSGLALQSIRLEQERIGRPKQVQLVSGHHLLTLEIDFPMTGLIYELSWKPLAHERSEDDPE